MAGIIQGLLASFASLAALRLYVWGAGTQGQIGNSTVESQSSPVQVGALTDWSQPAGGRYHSAAIKNDNTLWTWGHNQQGQLGLGNFTFRSSPTQVGALTNWAQVSASFSTRVGSGGFTASVKTDGTLWGWGNNSYGQVGVGPSPNSPVQIGAASDWAKVAAGGDGHTIAVKTTGTLWALGRNSMGQLGDNTVVAKSSPVQIGALTSWKQPSAGRFFSVALRDNGSIWSWGNGQAGRLGNNSTVYRSSPVQVGTITTWKEVRCGNYHVLAVRDNNTLWAWGNNLNGQLGTGNAIYRSSAVQVGALTNWAFDSYKFAGGYQHSVAVKTDGTVWAWGLNTDGQLGYRTTLRSSPSQIGSGTNWYRASAGAKHTLATTKN